jgi:hypothetical protein
MIFHKLIELRRQISGLKARKSTEAYGPQFPVRSSKELMDKLNAALNNLDLLAYPVDITLVSMEVPATTDKQGNPKMGGTCCYATTVIRVEAEDGSYRDFHGMGCGADRDDKAGGKASTYAWKDALLKGLSIPDAEMVDTDDEAGHARDIGAVKGRGGTRATSGGSRGGSGAAAAEEAARRRLEGASTKAELDSIVPLLQALPPDVQARLNGAYLEAKGRVNQ